MERRICAIVTVMYIYLPTARQYDLTFKNCYGINYCNDQKSYTLKYYGESLGSSCKITFHGYDQSNTFDKYKTCIRATEWIIYEDDVILTYFSDKSVLSNNIQQTYSKFTTPEPTTEWCSEPDEYVDVQLTTSYNVFLRKAKITLEIYAVKTFDYGKMVGIIVGSVMGGLAVIAIIVAIIIIFACRRKRQPGTVLSTYNAGFATGTNQISEFGNASYSVDTAPPSYHNATHNQYPAYRLQNISQPDPQET